MFCKPIDVNPVTSVVGESISSISIGKLSFHCGYIGNCCTMENLRCFNSSVNEVL